MSVDFKDTRYNTNRKQTGKGRIITGAIPVKYPLIPNPTNSETPRKSQGRKVESMRDCDWTEEYRGTADYTRATRSTVGVLGKSIHEVHYGI